MKSNPHSEQIEARLNAVRGRIRRVQRTRGTMVVATVALGGLFLMMGADFLFSPLPVAVRWILFGVWVAAVLTAARFGFGPMLKPIGLLQVARWLEGRHPEMEERLSTVLELARDGGGVSAELLESLGRMAEADVGKVDANAEVRTARTTRKWARPAIALLALLAVVLAVWPQEASRLLVRAVAPFSDLGNAAAGRFKVTPGDMEVLSGDPVRINVSYSGGGKDLEIAMKMEKGEPISQAMTKSGDGYYYLMDPARAGFRYHVRAGREESDGYTVTVWPMPEFLEPRATLAYPKYTGELSKELPVAEGIEAVVGTHVSLAGRTNTAIESAWLEVGGKREADGKIESSANGGRVEFAWNLTKISADEAVVKFKHRLGREVEALRFPIQVLDDQAPQVVLLSPMQKDLKVRADEVLPLKYEITEDFSVAKVAVEVDAGGNAKAMLDEALPVLVAHSKPPVFRGESAVSIGALRSRFAGANDIRVRVIAEDARPADLKGPGIGYSEWINLHIDQNAESLARQELREEHEGARKTIEETMRTAREGREKMDWHRGEIRNPEMSENTRNDFKKSAEQLAEAEAKLKELAKQMKESVHATKSDEVEKAAEAAAKAREELENSLLQDDPAQREAKLDQARNDARETEKMLEEIRNAMDRDRQKIEDLARIMDLAQKQQEVARQAEENLAKQDPTAPLPDDWKNQQRQMEEAIKQQLRERPDGKAEALKAQAAEAKELANEARQAAKTQENLEQQAKQISPDALRKALAEEQAKIAREANAELDHAREERNDLADTLPEAASAADAAKEQIEKGETQPAAESAKESAQAMKNAAEKAGKDQANNEKPAAEKLEQAAQAGKLEDLAKRQEQVAGAMDELAKGNTAEAMKKLQAEQAEAADKLAQDIETMPQLDGNGPMQEAKNNSKQADGQAEEAAKQGQQGNLAEASKQHGNSSKNFDQTAQALEKAAEEFNRAAAEAAAQQPNPQKAEVPGDAMAQAFQQASQAASDPHAAEAAAQAANAAQSLAKAAEAGHQAMQGKGQQGAPPPPGGRPGNMAGDKPEEGPREAEPDPGLPPELAKLGISSDDWAKIKESLKSDVGAGEAGAIPEEYRGLVKGYFESMSGKPNK